MGTVINPNGKPWYATASGITFIVVLPLNL